MDPCRAQNDGEDVRALIEAAPPCPLGPGTPQRELLSRLQQLTPSRLLGGRPPADEPMARCCLAGLWLLFDFLDESHRISQEVSSSSGSYWHAILHRREPDYSNAKYWFRRVGNHPIYAELAQAAASLAAHDPAGRDAGFLATQSSWDPFRFVDLCETAAHGDGSASELLCRRIAHCEWQLLFDYCYRHARGG